MSTRWCLVIDLLMALGGIPRITERKGTSLYNCSYTEDFYLVNVFSFMIFPIVFVLRKLNPHTRNSSFD